MRNGAVRGVVGGAVVISVSLFMSGCGASSKIANGAVQASLVNGTQNPLVAQYQVNVVGSAKVWVEFGTDTSYGRETSSIPAAVENDAQGQPEAVVAANVLVAGMKPSTTYHMRAHVDWDNGASWADQDHAFNTGAVPSDALKLAVTRSTPLQGTPKSVPQPGVELVDVVNPTSSAHQAFVTDLDGNLLWYNSDLRGAIPIKLLSNGHMLGYTADGSTLREFDLAGNTIRELSVQQLTEGLLGLGHTINVNKLHHDILMLPNGHFILLASTEVPYTNLTGYPGTIQVIGDVLVDVDQDWKPVWVWSAFDHLDVNRHLQSLPDWTHSNAVLYTPNDGNLLLSVRHQSWILKIDYNNGNGTGAILWRLGDEGDFTLAGGDPTQWFYAQHYPNILNINGSQMTFALFDNGNLRILDATGTECSMTIPCYSRATKFQIDESAKTAQLLWQYLPGVFSFWGGSIDVVDNGNIEFDMSSPFGNSPASRVMEVTQDANPTVVWQMDIKGANAYRAYRIPSLYPGVTWTQ